MHGYESGQIESHSLYLFFLLGGERLALPISAVERVVQGVFIAPPPFSETLLLGLADIEGKVEAVVSLATLLKLKPPEPPVFFVVMVVEGERWVFPVETLEGVKEMERVEGSFSYFKAPGLLDEALVASAFRRGAR